MVKLEILGTYIHTVPFSCAKRRSAGHNDDKCLSGTCCCPGSLPMLTAQESSDLQSTLTTGNLGA